MGNAYGDELIPFRVSCTLRSGERLPPCPYRTLLIIVTANKFLHIVNELSNDHQFRVSMLPSAGYSQIKPLKS